MPTEQSRNKRVEKAQLRVLFNVPFFAPGVAKLPIVWDDTIPTACTDGKEIRWNPEWFDTLDDPVLVTVLCHEVCHPLLGHLWRMPAGGDHELWNQAADHAVNLMLKEFGAQVTSRRLANPFPFPDPQDAYCANPKYSGWSEEAVFADLIKNQPPQPKQGSKSPQSGSGGKSIQSGAKGSPTGQGSGKAPPQNGSGSGRKPFGEFTTGKGTTEQRKKDQNDWQNTLLQSVAAAKGRGDVPGCVSRFVEELMNPKVPWVELLRNWLREKAEDDWNWLRPNPYFSDSDFILPSLDSERMGAIVFATDTSGSINERILAQFQAEKQGCLDDMKPAKLIDIYCDAKITLEKEYRVGEQIECNAPGGGGTSFVPVFKRLSEFTEKPKLLVYLTDLDGSFPEREPDFPVLWVAYGSRDKAPFGEVVKAEA